MSLQPGFVNPPQIITNGSYHLCLTLTFLPLLFLPLDDDGLLVLPGPLYFRLRRPLRLADLSGIDSMP